MSAATKQWLAKSHILVPDDWLQACVDWITEENQGVAPAQDVLNSQVYEQWLLSDLHELETQCLPADVTTATKFELNGAYALQIDSILDVGKSFYSQQQKFKGTENANSRVNAEEPDVKPWEMKPSRMLKMTLTDGRHSVQGMEYKPISSLNPQTPPGSKILVYGSILCRHGVLMLSENSVKFLGGEVDTLVEANTILNTIQAAMDASVEHAEKHARQEFSGSEIIASQKPRPSQLQGRPGQTTQQPQQPWQQARGTKQEVKSQPYNPVKTEIHSQIQNGTQSRTANVGDSMEDQWDDDPFLEDMDLDDFEQSAVSPPNTTRNTQGTSRGNSLTGTGISNKPEIKKNDDNRTSQTRTLSKTSDIKKIKIGIGEKKTTQSNMTSFVGSGNLNSNHGNVNRKAKIQNKCNNNSINVVREDDFSDDIDFEDDMDEFPPMDEEAINVSSESKRKQARLSGNKQMQVNSIHRATNKTESVSSGISSNRAVASEETGTANTGTGSGGSRSGRPEVYIEVQTTLRDPCASEGSSVVTPVKKETVAAEAKSDVNLYIQDEYPFTYISRIMALPKQEVPVIHTVKAYISTLTSRLSSDSGKWSLACKINDGSMAIEVDISDSVLTEMIGFSCAESLVLRIKAKHDLWIKNKLKKGIQDFQQKLVNLVCLLELEVSSRQSRPVVVATREISSSHIDMLYNRVTSSWGKFGNT